MNKIIILLCIISALLFLYAYLMVEPFYAEISGYIFISTIMFSIFAQVNNLFIKNKTKIKYYILKINIWFKENKENIKKIKAEKELKQYAKVTKQKEQAYERQNKWSL